MNDLLRTPMRFKVVKSKEKVKNPRSRYTRKHIPVKRRSHRSMIFEVKEETKTIKVSSFKVVKNIHRPKSRAVIRKVNINDIQFADGYGYHISYCKWCDFGVNVVPVSLCFARYEEAYQAFKEAYRIQKEQGIF